MLRLLKEAGEVRRGERESWEEGNVGENHVIGKEAGDCCIALGLVFLLLSMRSIYRLRMGSHGPSGESRLRASPGSIFNKS